jgi:hypothetical protein
MRTEIIKIIESKYNPDVESLEAGTAADEIIKKFTDFTMWKDNLHSPFETVYNGEDKSRPKVYYKKGGSDKPYSIEQVYEFWTQIK